MSEKNDLLQAVEQGDLDAVRQALDAGASPDAADRYGVTALVRAAGRGDLEAIELLLDRGAKVDKSSDQGNTPLMLAAARGHGEAVACLLQAGADPNQRNKWDFTAHDWAKWPANAQDVQALIAGAKS